MRIRLLIIIVMMVPTCQVYDAEAQGRQVRDLREMEQMTPEEKSWWYNRQLP